MECSICFNSYNETNHQPNVLGACGHTHCKECIPQLISKQCPMCKRVFENFAPNWSLIEQLKRSRLEEIVDKKIS